MCRWLLIMRWGRHWKFQKWVKFSNLLNLTHFWNFKFLPYRLHSPISLIWVWLFVEMLNRLQYVCLEFRGLLSLPFIVILCFMSILFGSVWNTWFTTTFSAALFYSHIYTIFYCLLNSFFVNIGHSCLFMNFRHTEQKPEKRK